MENVPADGALMGGAPGPMPAVDLAVDITGDWEYVRKGRVESANIVVTGDGRLMQGETR
jgi:hypothetical protein